MSIETTWSCSFEVTRLTFVKFFTMVVSFVFIEQDLRSALPATLVTRESPGSMHCLDVLAEVALIFHHSITDRTSCTNTSFVNNLLMFDCGDLCTIFEITVTVATIKHCEFFKQSWWWKSNHYRTLQLKSKEKAQEIVETEEILQTHKEILQTDNRGDTEDRLQRRYCKQTTHTSGDTPGKGRKYCRNLLYYSLPDHCTRCNLCNFSTLPLDYYLNPTISSEETKVPCVEKRDLELKLHKLLALLDSSHNTPYTVRCFFKWRKLLHWMECGICLGEARRQGSWHHWQYRRRYSYSWPSWCIRSLPRWLPSCSSPASSPTQ